MCLLVSLGGALFAFALRLATLWTRDVWIDEALTQYALSLDWKGLIADRVSAGHSPVYFLLLKALGLDPANLVGLRAASAVLDSMACGVLGFAVARHVGLRAAVFTQSLYALQPVLLIWAQNARPYALMMLMLAIALLGAMEVIVSRGQRRWPGWLVATGLVGASITLTGGLIAATLIAVSPLASARFRSDTPLCRHWLRLLRVPVAAAVAMLVIVTLPHVVTASDTYWTLRAVPFGTGSLVDLVQSYAIGDRLAWRDMTRVIGVASTQLTILGVLVVMAAAALKGVIYLRWRPAFIPLFALAFAFPLLFLGMSLYTSLLVPRYFLPAMGATTALAGIGLAEWSRTPAGVVVAAVLMLVVAIFAVNQSLAPGMGRNAVSRQMADIILPLSDDRTQVLTMRGDYVGVDLRTEILPASLGRRGHPTVRDADPTQTARLLQEGAPVFLIATRDAWDNAYAPVLPPPGCQWQLNAWVLAYWGKAGPCTGFSG
ncbi:MAG: hypothetical protein DI533_03525 [Cereibacter sphaeroides]|uniref:Glycosyltransferase RgtA/B/C/D-like domain-containing protein n=1 Tax=Cereibacter sphaeroides TaxID=1063 RepID=A0A2W5SIZ1_CERSP|nr:MAG: hypothetical protein DI533_03525 [Cereibacter sphaeroides]